MEKENSLNNLRTEITSLKSELAKINAEKETWFKEKEEQKKKIKELINEIKDLKGRKDSFNVVYQELKTKRDEHNKKVSELISKIKELNTRKKETSKKLGIKYEPTRIKEMITKLEERIETEALPFKKEKEVMEEIKKLRKAYEESGDVAKISEEAEKISKEIDENRQKATEYHTKLKEHIKANRGYRDFISLSRQIEFLKNSQEKAFNTFLLLKNKFLSLNKVLKYKLFEAKKINEQISNKKKQKEEKKKEFEKKIIEEKAKIIEEKFKNTKKLTTEDLIVLGKKDEP